MNDQTRDALAFPLKDLKPHPKNPNKHDKAQIERLCKLIQEHGVRHPIIVSNRSGFIVAGHGRKMAAEKLGYDFFPVEFQDFESEEQEYQFLVADNAIADWSGLDLSQIQKDIENLGPFDLELLGIEDFRLEPEGKEENEEGIPTELPTEAKTKVGDLWILGSHRLVCGDSTHADPCDLLMGSKPGLADMVFTDPPYNLASDAKLLAARAARAVRDSYDKLKNSDWDKNFKFEDVINNLEHCLSPNSTIYVCTSHFLFGEIQTWLKSWADITNYVVWAKPNPMPSLAKRHWTWSTELIAYGTKGDHTFNFPEKGHAVNVWNINKNAKNELHPTQKPVAVPEHAILHSSKPGDLVVDLFMGSGSTLIAAEKTGRRCYGMELDPKYCDVVIERWQKYANQEAIRGDGVKFNEL